MKKSMNDLKIKIGNLSGHQSYGLKIRMVVILALLATFGMAQNVLVKGKVTEAGTGVTIPAANVVVKGTTIGIATDNDGNYSLTVPANGTLVFSFLGYKPIEVPVAGKKEINVSLTANAVELEEFVTIGYGTQRRTDLTGAVGSVSGKELEKNPVVSVAQALTGKIAGVQSTTTDGSPDAEYVIRVRGGGSVTQDNSPLFIVDGFPVNTISNIPPSDVENVDVLKDAASSAIYGARGANGVIIITTKSAKAGKTTISYNYYLQAKTMAKKLDVLSPYEFVLAQYEYASLRGGTDLSNFNTNFGVYDDLELYKYQKGTDWQDELWGRNIFSKFHNLSIMGGNEKTKFTLSGTYNSDEGLLVGSGFTRFALNFKLNHEISKKLQLDLSARFSDTKVDGAGTAGAANLRVTDGLTARPVNGLLDVLDLDPNQAAEDYATFSSSLINPKQLAAQDWRNRKTQALNVNVGLTWKIIKDLSFRSEVGYDKSFEDLKRYYGPLTTTSKNEGGNLPLGELTTTTSPRYRVANTLTYNFKPGQKHELNLMAGQEIISGNSVQYFQRAKYFSETLSPEKMFANMALGTVDRISTNVGTDDKLASFFGRAIYQYDKRYLATFTIRADGSSKFAPGNRWGFFPAAALGWRISEEEFMKGKTSFSNLKLRVSVGEAGNNRIGSDLWKRSYAISNTRTYGLGDVANPYYAPASSLLVNPDLKWETTITRNAGLDFGLFHNKLSGTLDLYWNTTKDLLVESDIPSYLGYSKQMRNIGQTSNKGAELTLNGHIIEKKDFSLSASFNIGINKSNIDELDGVNEKTFSSNWSSTDLKNQDDYRLRVGQTVGLMYGYVTDGFYSVDDFSSYDAVKNLYVRKDGVPFTGLYGGTIGIRPGTLKLKDISGPNGVPDGVIDGLDRTVIGNATPKNTGGFGLEIRYKQFDLTATFNWVYGNDIYNANKIAASQNYRTTYGNMLNTMNYASRFKYINDAGTVVTDLEQLRAINHNANIWSPFSFGSAVTVIHSWAIEDGSFLRLNNLTLGYTLPKRLSQKIGMSNLRFYATGTNLWIWTNYTGYDPEVSSTVRNSSYNALTPGVDFSAYPKSRSITVGVNVTF
ncbi:MAG: TonB-dependent receptor [Bacteroidia bacterium]|nr:TonB-dependent receptor [Bacteroidia bacterium]